MAEYFGKDFDGRFEEVPKLQSYRKITVLPLVFLIYYEVSGGPFGIEDSVRAGGPFGIEDSVRAGGPLLALLGILVFAIVWSIPEALVTAELGTMFPENAGHVVWVSSALGSFWGFQEGWMKWLSGVIDNALYPVLFLDYLKSEVPFLEEGLPRMLAVLLLTIALTYMSYRGLNLVGWTAIALGILSIIPFVVMGILATPKIRPYRWLLVDISNVDWDLNALFWNLNYWGAVSTLAGEVKDAKRTLPKALFYALILVVLEYFIPLLTGIGAVFRERESWTDGYFSDIAMTLGGAWLWWWIQGASALSNMGMFVAEMSSNSFQLLGMAKRGMLPEVFSRRSLHGTPTVGILFSVSGIVLLSWLSFQEIIAAENYLYSFGMILEFVAFMSLRVEYPSATRPYKIPVGTLGAVLLCIAPTALIFVVLTIASLKVISVSIFAVLFGFVLYPYLEYMSRKKLLKFSVTTDFPNIQAIDNEGAESDIGRTGLLSVQADQ